MVGIDTLPAAISQFIAAANSFDGDALMDAFNEDALINDFQREFWGYAAIKKFTDREFIGDRVTMDVTEIRQHHELTVVSAKMDGTYDKTNLPNPLILTFYFTLHEAKISTLIIIHNKPVT